MMFQVDMPRDMFAKLQWDTISRLDEIEKAVDETHVEDSAKKEFRALAVNLRLAIYLDSKVFSESVAEFTKLAEKVNTSASAILDQENRWVRAQQFRRNVEKELSRSVFTDLKEGVSSVFSHKREEPSKDPFIECLNDDRLTSTVPKEERFNLFTRVRDCLESERRKHPGPTSEQFATMEPVVETLIEATGVFKAKGMGHEYEVLEGVKMAMERCWMTHGR